VLGAWVVSSGLQPFVNTLHVVNGALVLGTSLVLTLRSFRPLLDRVLAPDAAIRVAGSRFEVPDSRQPLRPGAGS
jgi:heme A synthase